MTEQPASATEQVPAPSSEQDGTWAKELVGGILLLGLSVFLWWYFTDFENSTETSRRMNAILAMLYNLGGKWLAIGVVAAVGLWQTISGALGFARQKKTPEA
jgi:hypothetical protein